MKNVLKNASKFIFILLLVLLLFRKIIFKHTIQYTASDTRALVELTDTKLLQQLAEIKITDPLTIDQIITIADELTVSNLSFTTRQSTSNPNEVLKNGEANCIGYAALYAAIVHHLIQVKGEAHLYEAKHLVGHLSFLGYDLHSLFDSPFFSDHDYNAIHFLEDGTHIYTDSSLSDYLDICRVSG